MRILYSEWPEQKPIVEKWQNGQGPDYYYRFNFDNLKWWWKARRCKHVFKGPDMQPRDFEGMIEWPCSKCGKTYREPYGLAMLKYGKITGPWGTVKE